MKKMIVILLTVVLVLSLAACGQSSSAKDETKMCIDAHCDSDGIAYVPLMSGKVAKIDDDVAEAKLTPDRTRIVVLTKDGVLYYTDTDQAKKTEITDKGDYTIYVRDEGVLYKGSDGNYHRYLFADGSDVNIGGAKHSSSRLSETGFNAVFAIDSSMYILPENAHEKEKIGSTAEYCRFLYLSDDCKTVYWQEIEDDEATVFISVNGEKTKLGTFETSSRSTDVTYNKNHKFAVVTNYDDDILFVVPESGEPIKVKLGNALASEAIYTKAGPLSEDTSSAFSGIYVCVRGSDGNNLYYIDANGEREKVLSGIGSYVIYDDFIYFVDEDDNLKTAKLAEETLSKEEKITGHVDIMDTSTGINNDGYIYFIRNYDDTDETGTLYVCKKGSDPKKIASDVTCYKYGSGGMGSIPVREGADGKTIYYFKDCIDITDNGPMYHYAVLYKCTYGDSEPTRIASDVVVNTISSGYASGAIDNNSFLYLKYYSIKDGAAVGDWYYYNGKESVRMASDIIY